MTDDLWGKPSGKLWLFDAYVTRTYRSISRSKSKKTKTSEFLSAIRLEMRIYFVFNVHNTQIRASLSLSFLFSLAIANMEYYFTARLFTRFTRFTYSLVMHASAFTLVHSTTPPYYFPAKVLTVFTFVHAAIYIYTTP